MLGMVLSSEADQTYYQTTPCSLTNICTYGQMYLAVFYLGSCSSIRDNLDANYPARLFMTWMHELCSRCAQPTASDC
jgi:hypothetical protein